MTDVNEAADRLRKERKQRADAQIIDFMESGEIDGIIRVLPDHIPGRPSVDEVGEAVYQAVESFYRQALDKTITSVGGYVYRAARNILLKQADKRMRSVPYDDVLDHEHGTAETSRDLRPALIWLEHVIEQWPTEHVRTITLIVIRAALDGQQVTGRDIVDHLRATGEDISEAAARTWKSRGLQRLAAEVARMGVELDVLLDTAINNEDDDQDDDESEDMEVDEDDT